MGTSPWELFSRPNSYHPSSDASLFSSSLPVLAHGKLNLNELNHDLQSVDDVSTHLNGLSPELAGKNHAVGLLPDDEDELLAGVVDGFDIGWLPSLIDDSDDFDVFGSEGGLELEYDPQEILRLGVSTLSLSDGSFGNGMSHSYLTNGVGTVAGEHPLGEHPSRTLFVRNINCSVEDSELRTLFEQYGDVRTLYTACKHRGFVMISYYDIRAARTAMRSLQNKPLRRRKLDIHFSIPKENPSDKDLNQGTLVVFNLDPSVTNDELQQIFGAYGEVKEIRETPHKRHHKFVEFYDVRAAEAALKYLNRSDIAGKRIKLEPSRPGGASRSLLMNLNYELEQDDMNSHQAGSLLGNSPPAGNWPRLSSPVDWNSPQNFSKSPCFSSLSPPVGNSLPGFTSVPPNQRGCHVFSNGNSTRGIFEQSHSLLNRSSFGPLSGPQLSWGSSEQKTTESRTQTMKHPFIPSGHIGFPYPSLHGSAPSGGCLERQLGYIHKSPKTSFMSPPFEGTSYEGQSFMDNICSHGAANGSPVFSMTSSPRQSPVFLGNQHFPGLATEHGRSRHVESNGIPIDCKKHFQLDLDKIRSGEDTRTTLMIKNIPNKYASKMLLATIDQHHKGTYDFFYLPIDFKNRCNVGYAFINMLSPLNIIPFYEAFNGKKWEKFNSEKVASLAYARIQGKAALIAHFQNSSLMNEDKCCRPILFDSGSPESNNKMIPENLPTQNSNGSKPPLQVVSINQVEKR